MFENLITRVQFRTVLASSLMLCSVHLFAQSPVDQENNSVSIRQKQFVKNYLLAEEGVPEAQYTVGMIYYSGQQVPKDIDAAVLWLNKAAEQDYADAQYLLCLIYGLGDGVVQDDKRAVEWCQKAAEQGHANAQYTLGQMYAIGQGLEQDEAMAIGWWTLSAEQGHLDAMCDLGLMYQSGRGVQLDTNKAIQWWTKAAQLGHAWSGLLLQEAMMAELVSETNGSAEDEAKQLIRLLAEDLDLIDRPRAVPVEHQVAQPPDPSDAFLEARSEQPLEQMVVNMSQEPSNEMIPPEQPNADDVSDARQSSELRETKGIEPIPIPLEKDSASAKQPYDSIEAGDAAAQYDSALAYYEGNEHPRDFALALQGFTIAAEQGYAPAQYKLGVMYSFGQGVPQDSIKAVQWFRRAAQQGDPAAQYSLGVMYATGQGVQSDPEEAAQWYSRAAEQGSVAAQYMLGVIYSQGQGVVRDPEKAIHWYLKAAEQGSPMAQYLLGLLYEKGQGVVYKDAEKSIYWFTEAAQRGHADAQYQLAEKYSTGQGVEKDYVKAYMWCLLASLNGKDTAWYQHQLEARMTPEQLEQSRRNARDIIDSNNSSSEKVP